VITRVNIRNVRHAVHLVGRNRNVIVSDCHLYHNRGVGLYLDDVDLHQINVGTSHISYNAAGGIVVRAGNVRNLQVSGCDIEANMSADGPSAANVLIDCTEGAAGCAEVAIVGCTIQHTHSAKGSANVRYLAADPKGRTWGNVTIADNVLSDVERNIDIHHARGVSITGNTLWTGVEHDIVIEDSSNVVIGPNVFDRNPPYRDEKTAANGVLLRNCTDVTLTGLHVNGVRRVEAGVILEGCRRANISGCTILDCDNAGLLLRNVSDSRVSGCLMRDDRPDAPPWTPLRMIDCRGVVADELPKGESAVPAGPKDSASPGDR
jgi:parallel beta-helix repeat protein